MSSADVLYELLMPHKTDYMHYYCRYYAPLLLLLSLPLPLSLFSILDSSPLYVALQPERERERERDEKGSLITHTHEDKYTHFQVVYIKKRKFLT